MTVSYPHNEYNNSHRAPVSQSQVNRSHADHEPDSTVFDIPSSPGVRLPLKRESVDESTKALADEFLNLDDTNSYSDEEAAFLGEECGPKIRTYRPYPAISAKEHGILNAPYGNRHTNPNHLERALERANQFPIVWRPRAQSHILLCEGRSIENYPIAIHAAKKVKFLSSLVREVKWKPGVDFEAAQSTNKVISKEAGDLKKLFPTVYDDFHAPDKGFFEGIIEDIVLAEE